MNQPNDSEGESQIRPGVKPGSWWYKGGVRGDGGSEVTGESEVTSPPLQTVLTVVSLSAIVTNSLDHGECRGTPASGAMGGEWGTPYPTPC